MKIEYLQ